MCTLNDRTFWKTHSYVIATTHNTFLLANTDTHLRSLLHTVGYLLFWKHIHMPLPLHTTRSVWQTDWHSPVSDCYYTLYLLLGKKYSHVIEPKKSDICYATTNRQMAVKKIASNCDLFIVIGAYNSSNSLRLVEVAKQYGANKSILIENADESILKHVFRFHFVMSIS